METSQKRTPFYRTSPSGCYWINSVRIEKGKRAFTEEEEEEEENEISQKDIEGNCNNPVQNQEQVALCQ